MSDSSVSLTLPKNTATRPRLPAPPVFDHERLDVYNLELQFLAWVTQLLDEISGKATGRLSEACDQLDRASLSALLNTAEGNGKRRRPGRAKFFDDARGSATEYAACLDALVAKQATTEDRILEGKRMLARIVSMLCALVERFDEPGQLRDEPNLTDLHVTTGGLSYGARISRTRTRTRTRRNARTKGNGKN